MVHLMYQPPNFNNTNDLQGEHCVFLETIRGLTMKSQSSMATKGNRLRVKKALSIGTVSYGILNCGVGEDS